MDHPIRTVKLPSLTTELLQADGILVDNKFAELWKSMGMNSLLSRAGFNKRSGASMSQVVYNLSLWIWLKKDSIGMFARESLSFLSMGKDVLYDTLNREDLNWRKYNFLVAHKAVQTFTKAHRRAFVVDDSIKQRFGKRMPGVSRHFDHTTGRSIKGQQVITLGLSCNEGFVPLDSELFTSKVDARPLGHELKDGRSTVGKRFRDAIKLTKPEMLTHMVKRALNQGIEANYLLADAWFGSRAVLRLCEETNLVGILRMKKGKLKYRLSEWINGQVHQQEMDAKALYQHSVRKKWARVADHRYQAKVLDVEVNLAESKKDQPHWIKVRLLFVRGTIATSNDEAVQVKANNWALFVSTDTSLSANEILEYYAMRWAIEVYFKEAKQHLGFLKEQSTHYATYIASIHLTAIRFCLLMIAKQTQGEGTLCKSRRELCDNSQNISFACKLWSVFRAIITGALDSMADDWGIAVESIMQTLEDHMNIFFIQVLQLDSKMMCRET